MRALVFALVLGPLAALAAEPTPEVIAGPAVALDGDTLQIGEVRVRLFGIDAPEMKTAPWGGFARAALDDLIAGRKVACEVVDIDRYKRPVARCAAGGVDLSGAMARAGWAYAYRRFSLDYDADERAARASRRGLWAALPVAYAEGNPGFWDELKSWVAAIGPTLAIIVGAWLGFRGVIKGQHLNAELALNRDKEQIDKDARTLASGLASEVGVIGSQLNVYIERTRGGKTLAVAEFAETLDGVVSIEPTIYPTAVPRIGLLGEIVPYAISFFERLAIARRALGKELDGLHSLPNHDLVKTDILEEPLRKIRIDAVSLKKALTAFSTGMSDEEARRRFLA